VSRIPGEQGVVFRAEPKPVASKSRIQKHSPPETLPVNKTMGSGMQRCVRWTSLKTPWQGMKGGAWVPEEPRIGGGGARPKICGKNRSCRIGAGGRGGIWEGVWKNARKSKQAPGACTTTQTDSKGNGGGPPS